MRRGRKLEREISVGELLQMRKEMSVKEIAACLDVSVGTVYKYIGKKSVLAAQAVQQNKQSPIPIIQTEDHEERQKEEVEVSETREIRESAVRLVLKVLRESVVRDLQGSACVFHLDTGSNIIEMKDDGKGTVAGILQLDDIPLFIAELDHVYKMMRTGA